MDVSQFLENEKKRLGCYGTCNPDSAVLCRTLNHASTWIAGWHCQQCGCWKAVKNAAVENVSALPERDDSVLSRVRDETLERWRAEKEAASRSWWSRYSAYLKTEKWRKKSAMVVARDVTCQACLARPATQAHHLTYEHVGDEPLFDLRGVCEPCHVKITKMDRARRETGATPLDEVDP